MGYERKLASWKNAKFIKFRAAQICREIIENCSSPKWLAVNTGIQYHEGNARFAKPDLSIRHHLEKGFSHF